MDELASACSVVSKYFIVFCSLIVSEEFCCKQGRVKVLELNVKCHNEDIITLLLAPFWSIKSLPEPKSEIITSLQPTASSRTITSKSYSSKSLSSNPSPSNL